MDRLRNLHVGQVVIIGIVTGILGLGFLVGGALAHDALEQALRERGRLPEPGVSLARPAGGDETILEEFLRLVDEDDDPIRAAIRRARIAAAVQAADRRVWRARTAMIGLWGATPLLFLGYLGVLWIWFGGRRTTMPLGEQCARLRRGVGLVGGPGQGVTMKSESPYRAIRSDGIEVPYASSEALHAAIRAGQIGPGDLVRPLSAKIQ